MKLVLNSGEIVALELQKVSDNPETDEEAYAGRDKQNTLWWLEPILVEPMAGRTDLLQPLLHGEGQ